MHSELLRVLYAIETMYFSAGFETNRNTESGTKYDRLMGLYDENDLRGQDPDSESRNSTTQLFRLIDICTYSPISSHTRDTKMSYEGP